MHVIYDYNFYIIVELCVQEVVTHFIKEVTT